MELDAAKIKARLQDKGVDRLYHANTVRTTCTFLRAGALLSRGTLDERDLDQTPQVSDTDDRALGIWYDIFFDSEDLGAKLNRRNEYGPVLLAFDIDMLDEDWFASAWITKSNPIYWKQKNISVEDRWFGDDELGEYEPTGKTSFKNSIVLRHVGGVLRLQPYLKEITIDQPNRGWPGVDKSDLMTMAWAMMYNSARSVGTDAESGIPLPLVGVEFKIKDSESYYKGVSKDSIMKLFGP